MNCTKVFEKMKEELVILSSLVTGAVLISFFDYIF